MSAERVVQAAVYSALTGNAPYMALVTGVFDFEAPQGQSYDYTVLGDITEILDATHDHEGWGLTLTIHDWHKGTSRRPLQLIREARDTVLHRAALSVAGFGLTRVRREFSETLPDQTATNEPLRHQVTRYRVEALAS